MKKLELNQMESCEGGKFWGNGEERCTDVDNGAGQVLYQWCCHDYYVFWMKVDTVCN